MTLSNLQVLIIISAFIFLIGCFTIYILKSRYMKIMSDHWGAGTSDNKLNISFNFRTTEALWVVSGLTISFFIVGLFGVNNNENKYIESLEENNLMKQKIEAFEFYKNEIREGVKNDLLIDIRNHTSSK